MPVPIPKSFTARGVALASAILAYALLYGRVFHSLYQNWVRDPNYSHGFIILPIAAYLVWQRRERLAAEPLRPAMIGLLLIATSLAMLLVGTAGIEFFLMRTSAIGVLAGAILFIAGWGWLRILRFPLAFSLLMIPIPAIVFYRIAFPLQLLATRFGVGVLQFGDIPVLREGNVIILTQTTLEVAEACSGIRSLVSLFTLAVLYGYFSETRRMPRVLIALSSIPIAIVMNGLRVAGTGIAAHYIGGAAATGFFHTFSGWLVFVVSFIALAAVVGAVRRLPDFPSTRTLVTSKVTP
jgi:exosortase